MSQKPFEHEASGPPGEIPIPHGPPGDHDRDDYPDQSASEEERRVFSHVTRPEDTYTPEGVYWADIPWLKRWSFVGKVDNQAAKDELSTIGKMMKADPLSPIGWYFRNCVIPGAGLGLEGYVLFSIGNLTPLFSKVWPECWKTNEVCSKNWISAVSYLEIVGIIVGQVLVGVLGDWVGRRWGLIQDAIIMFIGLIMLTASWGLTLNGWVICYAWSLFFYSVGVGGEYPITATASLESAITAGKLSTKEDRLHRGRRVTQAFLMQGWGQFFNQVILIVLLIIFNSGNGHPPYTESSAQWTFRLSFAIPAIGTLWLAYYRAYKMPQASRQLAQAKKVAQVTGYDFGALKACCNHYGGRLIATAGAWFANDVFFYGNKLFQGNFISTITDSDSLMAGWTWNMVNVTVQLAGYYLASFLIDNKMYGRKNMQQVGFLMCFLMFVIPAFKFHYYKEEAHVHSFQAMYYLSSFFNQFGPNCVTFLVAGEVFPTPIRATAHGFSAACGKLGALFAAVLYSYIDDQTKFYVVPWFGLLGMVVTFVWLPDTTGLDLREQERRWRYLKDGRIHEYHGIACHPKHLSLWERFRGLGKYYDPELDWKMKIEDMRAEWDAVQATLGPKEHEDDDIIDDGDFNREIHEYFKRSGPNRRTGVLQEKVAPSDSSQ